jgi:lysophospholipase L1-like esterase
MNGKVKKLKSSEGEYLYPVTRGEAVYVDDNKTLDVKLQDLEAGIGAGGGDGTTSPWIGKRWCVIGDSITQANGMAEPGPYHKQIAAQVGLTAVNKGYGGWGYFNANSGAIYTKIDDGTGIDLTADLVTVWLGTNDWLQSPATTPLTTANFGAFGDTDKTATFYGAVDYTLKQLAEKFNGKPVAVFTPLPRVNAWYETPNAAGITLGQVSDAIIKVANKYGLPVFDLYRESNFNVWNSAFRSSYITDGLHPNVTGHTILSRKILSFLNTL